MRYDHFAPMGHISLSELTRRLGHEIEEILDDRPAGISRLEIALALQTKVEAVLLEERDSAFATQEVASPA